MDSTVRIGFIGAGGMGRAHREALSKIPGVELAAVTDASPEAAKAFAELTGATVFPSARALAQDSGVDAVYILVPPFAHGEPEIAALEAGIPFFVEKPVGLEMGSSKDLAAEVERKGLMTAAGYMNRYRSSVQRAKELLSAEPAVMAYGGWWGGTPAGGSHWWPDKSRSGGQFHEQVTHTIDLARYLMGEPVEVYAAAAKGFVAGVEGYSMDDAVSVVITFQSGAVANLMASVTSNAGGGVFLNLHSMNRNFRFTEWEHSLRIEAKGGEPEEIAGEPDIFHIEDMAFVDAVRTKNPGLIRSTYPDAVKTMAISLAANESIDSGQVVSVA